MTILINKFKELSQIEIIGVITIISVVLTAIIYLLMRPIELELTSQTVYGVIDLEFAWNVEQINQILSSWGDELITMEVNAVLLDFGFLVVYSLSLAGVSLLLTKFGMFGTWSNWGYYFTLIPFVAASFDVVENVNLLLILSSPSSFPSFAPLIASICATIKFGLIIATVVFWIAGLGFSIIIKGKESLRQDKF
ncbi:MAG: hypothetical protein ACW98F_07015 [Candidatus Hodarchaeales archaeon]|jgi:hypothetical protein